MSDVADEIEHRADENGRLPRPRLTLTSEFASVALDVDTRANGPRLRVKNLGNGRVIYLDPLEIASLTWLSHDDLGPFLDPSQTGWRSEEGAGK